MAVFIKSDLSFTQNFSLTFVAAVTAVCKILNNVKTVTKFYSMQLVFSRPTQHCKLHMHKIVVQVMSIA